MNRWKKPFFRLLVYLHVYPHIYFSFSPFKIYEFYYLLHHTTLSPDDLALDLGCGLGLQTILLGRRVKQIIGLDIAKESINQACFWQSYLPEKNKALFSCQGLEEAGLAPESFDKVFSFCVIEHIPDYKRIFEEVYRLLKKGGSFIFSVDSLATLGEQERPWLEIHRQRYIIHHYFAPEELEELLKEIGFNQVQVSPYAKSTFAKQLFIKGIQKGFYFGKLEALWSYYLLQYHENYWPKEAKDGLFLKVIARK